MKIRWRVFNAFLVCVALLLLVGCATSEERKKKKQLSNIRVHVEADRSGDRSSAISIHRSSPIMMNIQGETVFDEHDVVGAVLLENPDGTYAIQVKLNRRASWTLERITVAERGKHLAIFSYFGEGRGRWLAAPLITGKNSSGTLTFTPDASHEEAERIVRGLNNVARKLQRQENWPFNEPFDK